jgi:hypothetical protein
LFAAVKFGALPIGKRLVVLMLRALIAAFLTYKLIPLPSGKCGTANNYCGKKTCDSSCKNLTAIHD